MLQRLRDWLLCIPVLVVCAVAIVLSAALGLVADRAGENAVLVVPPLFGWFVTWVLALTHAHRVVAGRRSSLVRFGTPIAAALLFVVCTAYAGQLIANWFSTPAFPHQQLLP